MRRMIIDTDPGIDDTMAISLLLSSPEVKVEALTTVFGNVEVELGTKNALTILEQTGNAGIPVATGASRPILKPKRQDARWIHGDNGLGGVEFPDPKGKAVDQHAVQLIIDTVMNNPGEIEILALGPITNIALAVLLEPRLAENVKDLVFMGGAFFVSGNATNMTSANVFSDPEALKIVLNSGMHTTLVGLDVTTKLKWTEADLERMRQESPVVGRFAADVCQYRVGLYRSYGMEVPAFECNDSVAAIWTLRKDFFRAETLPVDVEVRGELTYGKTVGDFKGRWDREPNATIPLEIDADRAKEFFIQQVINGRG